MSRLQPMTDIGSRLK